MVANAACACVIVRPWARPFHCWPSAPGVQICAGKELCEFNLSHQLRALRARYRRGAQHHATASRLVQPGRPRQVAPAQHPSRQLHGIIDRRHWQERTQPCQAPPVSRFLPACTVGATIAPRHARQVPRHSQPLHHTHAVKLASPPSAASLAPSAVAGPMLPRRPGPVSRSLPAGPSAVLPPPASVPTASAGAGGRARPLKALISSSVCCSARSRSSTRRDSCTLRSRSATRRSSAATSRSAPGAPRPGTGPPPPCGTVRAAPADIWAPGMCPSPPSLGLSAALPPSTIWSPCDLTRSIGPFPAPSLGTTSSPGASDRAPCPALEAPTGAPSRCFFMEGTRRSPESPTPAPAPTLLLASSPAPALLPPRALRVLLPTPLPSSEPLFSTASANRTRGVAPNASCPAPVWEGREGAPRLTPAPLAIGVEAASMDMAAVALPGASVSSARVEPPPRPALVSSRTRPAPRPMAHSAGPLRSSLGVASGADVFGGCACHPLGGRHVPSSWPGEPGAPSAIADAPTTAADAGGRLSAEPVAAGAREACGMARADPPSLSAAPWVSSSAALVTRWSRARVRVVCRTVGISPPTMCTRSSPPACWDGPGAEGVA